MSMSLGNADLVHIARAASKGLWGQQDATVGRSGFTPACKEGK